VQTVVLVLGADVVAALAERGVQPVEVRLN
jgi:hypothetical protein